MRRSRHDGTISLPVLNRFRWIEHKPSESPVYGPVEFESLKVSVLPHPERTSPVLVRQPFGSVRIGLVAGRQHGFGHHSGDGSYDGLHPNGVLVAVSRSPSRPLEPPTGNDRGRFRNHTGNASIPFVYGLTFIRAAGIGVGRSIVRSLRNAGMVSHRWHRLFDRRVRVDAVPPNHESRGRRGSSSFLRRRATAGYRIGHGE